MSSATRRGEISSLPRLSAVSQRVIAKGRRAKRGRRRDYKDVFLQCGILNAREVAALDGLRAMRGEPMEVETTQQWPSANEGLRQCVERFVEYVGCSENETPVEFWIPQVAHELAVDEPTVKFIVEVLLTFQVLAQRECGTVVWRGRDAVCIQNRTNLMQLNCDNSEHSVQNTCDLHNFCLRLSEPLKDLSKRSFSKERLCQEMIKKVQNDLLQIQHQLDVVCSVLLGARILHEIQHGSELHYTLQPPSKPSVDLEKQSAQPPCLLPVCQAQASGFSVKPWNIGTPMSLSVVSDDNMAAKKMLESLFQRLNSTGSALQNNKALAKAPEARSIRATVMELAKTGICQVGVADVLGHGSLTSSNNEWSNSVIALAIPQWMLPNKQATHSTHQIHACEFVGLENGLPFNKQPLFMSYVPVTHGSLTELLGQAVNGHKALIVNAEALQSCSSVLKQF